MSPATTRVLVAMAIADLVVFGGWIAKEQLSRRGGQVRLPVEGYDPRDLLSGHFVRFRLVAEREAEALAGDREGELAFCVEEGEGWLLHVTRLRGAGDDCAPFLTGVVRERGRIDFGVDRFYVDERRANEVTFVQAGPDTYLVATIDGAGRVHAIDLVVSGKSIGARK